MPLIVKEYLLLLIKDKELMSNSSSEKRLENALEEDQN